MFKSKTCFVIGAGASHELDLPIGNGLTADIAKLINIEADYGFPLKKGDPQIYQILQMLHRKPEWKDSKFLLSGRELAEAMELAPSIDTFLQTHRDNAEYRILGKLGIAQAILKAERKCKLHASNGGPVRYRDIANTWYVSLAQHLFSGIPADSPASAFDNVSFIVFNYDRCLEVFLIRAVSVYFRIPQSEAQKIVSNVAILHPYGSIGPLDDFGPESAVFGDNEADLVAVTQRILTFSESVQDDDLVQNTKRLIRESETLVFLGFAFHEQNMDLLGDELPKQEKKSAVRRVYATTYGMSASDTQVVKAQIAHLLRGRPQKERDDYTIEMFPGKCCDLFAEYWRSLSASAETQSSIRRYNMEVLG
jgi:hypothetical protein